MKTETHVAIDKCENYIFENVFTSLKRVCEFANMPSVKGKKVLIKPNILSDAKPEDCITTNPEVVRATIRLLKEKGANEVFVGDSPGLHSSSFHAQNCGIGNVCKEEGAIWCDFTDKPVTKAINGTKYKLPMARILDEVDLVFSLCKFKTHQLMYTTGATKNLFGTLPGLNKGACHVKCPSRESFAKLIVGIAETVKPDFCIMDGIIGMEGPGPANGRPRTLSLLLASESCYALDTAQAIIMGHDEKDIPILNEARRRHLIPSQILYPLFDARELVIKDYDRIAVKEKTSFFKGLVIPFFTSGMQKRHQKKETPPSFVDDKCIRCLRCVNICPPKALSLAHENDGSKHIVCDLDKCIRCYCCHEMCPADAIVINEEKT